MHMFCQSLDSQGVSLSQTYTMENKTHFYFSSWPSMLLIMAGAFDLDLQQKPVRIIKQMIVELMFSH